VELRADRVKEPLQAVPNIEPDRLKVQEIVVNLPDVAVLLVLASEQIEVVSDVQGYVDVIVLI